MHFAAFLSLALLATSTAAIPITTRSTTGKAGIGVERWDGEASKLFTNTKFSWGYNWNGNRDKSVFPSNIKEYVPMCWGEPDGAGPGGKVKRTGDMSRNLEACKNDIEESISAGGVKNILGFNEPDHASEANMSVSSAVSAWRKTMDPFSARGFRLGSPAVTSSSSPNQGLDWLKQFLTACSGCKVDFIALHYYANANPDVYAGNDGGDLADGFKKHVQRARRMLKDLGKDLPIWVTEVGVMPGQPRDVESIDVRFMKEVVSWMDSQDYIERYAYFGSVPGDAASSKMVTDGELNALGHAYNTLP